MLNLTVISPTKIIFQGEVKSVILPGEMGVFEVMSYHKRMMTRLLRGTIEVDGEAFQILRGIVKIEQNNVTIVLEEETESHGS